LQNKHNIFIKDISKVCIRYLINEFLIQPQHESQLKKYMKNRNPKSNSSIFYSILYFLHLTHDFFGQCPVFD